MISITVVFDHDEKSQTQCWRWAHKLRNHYLDTVSEQVFINRSFPETELLIPIQRSAAQQADMHIKEYLEAQVRRWMSHNTTVPNMDRVLIHVKYSWDWPVIHNIDEMAQSIKDRRIITPPRWAHDLFMLHGSGTSMYSDEMIDAYETCVRDKSDSYVDLCTDVDLARELWWHQRRMRQGDNSQFKKMLLAGIDGPGYDAVFPETIMTERIALVNGRAHVGDIQFVSDIVGRSMTTADLETLRHHVDSIDD